MLVALVAGILMPVPGRAAVPPLTHLPVDVSPVRGMALEPIDRRAQAQATQPTAADEGIGYDISFPQCGGPFPNDAAFRIVGVNNGRAFTVNPCLGPGHGPSELEWAGIDAQLYINTGNPGPEISKAPWPTGQFVPRYCSAEDPHSPACAYDYGWNAAAHAYDTAVQAYIDLGWAAADARTTPVPNFWWLDVETGNSWRDETALNVAVLQGAIAYLETKPVAGIGIYSMGPMWERITGGTDAFVDYPNWVAGASTVDGARRTCIGAGFSGGVVALTQYLHDGFDANHRC